MPVHYVGGAELEYGGEAGGSTWARLVLSFQAPNPYWESATAQSFTVTSGNTGRGLLPQLTKLRVSSAQALGIINVNNTSDVPVFPSFEIVGPVDGLQVTLDGQGWTFTENVTTGDIYTVNHEDSTVTGIGGVNRYDILDTSPKFFAFPPGVSTVLVTGTNADLNTLIRCTYNLAFEVVHG
jgi:phage-related protein